MLGLTFLLSALVGTSLAQNLTVPNTWREIGQTRFHAQRVNLAAAGINRMSSLFDSKNVQYKDVGYWGSAATVLSAMANFDHFTSSTTYKKHVTSALNTAFRLYPNFDPFGFNDDSQWFATAAFYAYRAYGDKNLLNHTIANWNHVSKFQITDAVAKSGKLAGKNFTVEGKCGSASMVGGVFWRPGANDPAVNSVTTGLFMTLSAYLAQATKNPKYAKAAYAAGNWIKHANTNAAGLPLDTVAGDSCKRSPANWVFTYNAGKYVEGLTALYGATKNSSLLTEAAQVAAAGMKNGPWQGATGVITEGASRTKPNDNVYFKSVWVRALNELFRTTTNSQLNTLLHSYLVVQYNAMLGRAANGTSYSSAWAGPPQAFTAWGQAAALDNLVVGITSTT